MTMSGADVDALDRIGVGLEHASDGLRRKADRLNADLHSSPWRGPSADSFRHQFDSEYRRSIYEAARFLDDACEVLRRNADEQRWASDLGNASLLHDLELFFGHLPREISELMGFLEDISRGTADGIVLGVRLLALLQRLPSLVASTVVLSAVSMSLPMLIGRLISNGVGGLLSHPGGVRPGSFLEQVRSGRPGPQDLTLARLASEQPPAGWKRLDDKELEAEGIKPEMLRDKSGFAANVYRSNDGAIVLEFHGSDLNKDAAGDWVNNAAQYGGFGSEQYRQAIELATAMKAAYGDKLVLTGHSLGGGLASVAAVATDTHAVTFNPAAVNDETLKQAGMDPGKARSAATRLVSAYHLQGEILNTAQATDQVTGSVRVLGSTREIVNPNDVRNSMISWIAGPVAPLVLGTGDHLMPAVINGMERDPQFN